MPRIIRCDFSTFKQGDDPIALIAAALQKEVDFPLLLAHDLNYLYLILSILPESEVVIECYHLPLNPNEIEHALIHKKIPKHIQVIVKPNSECYPAPNEMNGWKKDLNDMANNTVLDQHTDPATVIKSIYTRAEQIRQKNALSEAHTAPYLVQCFNAIGDYYSQHSQNTSAFIFYNAARILCQKDMAHCSYTKLNNIILLEKMAEIYIIANKHPAAQALYEKELEILLSLYPDTCYKILDVRIVIAQTLHNQGQSEAAFHFVLSTKMPEHVHAVYGPEHMQTAHLFLILGQIYEACAQRDDAIASYQKTKALFELNQQTESALYASLLSSMGHLITETKDFDTALELYGQAHAIYIKRNDPRSAAHILNTVGLIFSQTKQYHLAMQTFEAAKSSYITEIDSKDTGIIPILNNMAQLHEQQDNIGAAIECYDEILTIHKDTCTLKKLACLWAKLHHYSKAEAYLTEALQCTPNPLDNEIAELIAENNKNAQAATDEYRDECLSVNNNHESSNPTDNGVESARSPYSLRT